MIKYHQITKSQDHQIKIIAIAMIACVLAVSNSCAKDGVTGATKKGKWSAEDLWLQSVRKANAKSAIKTAKVLNSKTQKISSVSKKYEKIAKNEGIAPAFFSQPFNMLDFKLWYDAWFLKDKLKEFGVFDLKNDKSKLKRIFDKVTVRIEPKEKEKALIPWPTGIWIRKYGLCDRQSWLFAEIAYQAGYDAQVVYLINPENGQSPHTICEVLVENDKGEISKYVVDPFSKVFLENKSIAELAADKELMKKIWPGREEWWKALPNSLFWTPAYPQDYCMKNQQLYKRLKAKLDTACPRFGENPEQRMLRYKKLSGENKFKMGLWYYPFRVLKAEIESKQKK